MPSIPEPPAKVFQLRAVTKRLLVEVEAKRFWVRAQCVPESGGRHTTGHFYCSLVDNDDRGKPAARMRAVIWRADRERIERKLQQAGQQQALTGEQEICALCAVRFHVVYGLSLEISDVDPTLGESLLEKNRRDVLERIRAAGLLELNGQLPLPLAPLRIGLITAPGSAAYADFTQTLLVSGFSFRVYLAHTAMQGDTTESQVIRAIRLLERRGVDVICLVRGGIGQAIARCRKPVWVGIGHEIDVTVPDFVSHTSHNTPTAVATALVQLVQALDTRLATSHERLEDICQRRLMLAERELDRSRSGMRQGLRKHLELHQARFTTLGSRLTAITRQLSEDQASLDHQQVRLRERVARALAAKEQQLAQGLHALSRGTTACLTGGRKDLDQYAGRLRMLQFVNQRQRALDERQRYLNAVRPERMLARGYSVTRDPPATSSATPGRSSRAKQSTRNLPMGR